MAPLPIALPTVRQADLTGPRSGRFDTSTGVGTVMMKISLPLRSDVSAETLSFTSLRTSGSISLVRSTPDFSSLTRSWLMSKPRTGKWRARATASGRPT